MAIANKTSVLYLASFCIGAVSVLGFAPFEIFWLPFISFAILAYFWLNATAAKTAFFCGFSFGLGLFLAGVSWVYVSLSTYGGMPLWMGTIAVLGFVSLLALFIGAVGWLSFHISPKNGATRLLLIPFVWVIFEWLKSWVLTGFPWLEVGYTQTPGWLFSLAPVGGIYLVSFATLVVACSLVSLLLNPGKFRWLLAPAILLISFLIQDFNWTQASGRTLNIGLVQGNVPIELKWQGEHRANTIRKYADLTQKLHAENALDLVVWPETALPLFFQQTDAQFWRDIKDLNLPLLAGLMDNPKRGETYNAAVLSCDGNQQIYRKRHLVPFGEYLPLRFLFNWVLEYLDFPMSDFSAAQTNDVLSCQQPKLSLSLSICYEDAFASEWRNQVGEATLLVNISEDAWFGDSLASAQRLQMAQMRAREHAKPLIRSANTGPSVLIDHFGQVLHASKQFETQALSVVAQPRAGKSPYVRFGDWIIYLSLLFMALMYVAGRKKSG